MQLPHSEENPYSVDLLKNFILLTALTSLSVFIFGNLLLLDKSTFITSLNVAVVVQIILFSIFSISYLTRSIAWGIAIIYITLAVSIYASFHWLFWVILACSLYGVTIFVKTTNNLRDLINRNLLKAIAIGALVIISAKVPVSFDMIDRLEQGIVHRDTLFHAAIASMIKSYGVISTGLNGLVGTPYHIFSHTLIASISSFSNTGVLETYGLAPLLLFLPLLIGSIAYTAATFGKTDYFYRYFMLTGFILAVAPRILKPWGLKESYFGSESYSVALTLMIVTIPLLFRKTYKHSDLALILIMLALMTLAKASVGAIFIGLLAVRIIWFVRSRDELLKESMLFIISASVIFYILSPALNSFGPHESIVYWEYVKHYSLLGKYVSGPVYLAIIPIVLFISVHFIFSWLVIKSRVSITGIQGASHDYVAIYSLAAIAGGLLIVVLPIMPGSTAGYFSNVAMFVSLPWFVIVMADKHISWTRSPYITALLIILVLKSTKLLDKTLFKRNHIPDQEHIAFVDTLLKSRDIDSADTYLIPANLTTAEQNNPVQTCMAKPFVYPAVSEKAWVGVINMNKGCDYKDYGYSQYFGDKGTNSKPLEARIPKNIKITTIDF